MDEGLLVGQSIEAFATASIYVACWLQRLPWFFEDFADCARVDEQRVLKAYKVLNRELELAIPPLLPRDYLARIATDADIPPGCEQYARTLLALPEIQTLGNGCNPCTVAAGCLYFAVRTTEGSGVVTQAELARIARITPPSLRKIWRALTELQEEHPERAPDLQEA